MAAKVQIIIEALDKASGAIGKVSQSLQKTGDSAKGATGQFTQLAAGWAKTALSAASLGAAALAVVDYLKQASTAAAAHAQIVAKQEAIIKATGSAAGFTSAALIKLADETERLTHIDGDLIVQSQSLMLTFRNISGDTFPRAMQAAIDLQTTFGSLEASTLQLGKALNDPVEGISALARSGVTFSEVQKQQIKDFVAVNDLASAQAIILAEVEAQVGGTAAAIAAAGDGTQNLTNATGALSEAIGRGVLPATREWNGLLAELAWNLAEAVDAEAEYYDIKAQATDVIRENNGEVEQGAIFFGKHGRSVRASGEELNYHMAIIERQNAYLALNRSELEALGVQIYSTAAATDELTGAAEENAQAISRQAQAHLRLAESLTGEIKKANEDAAEYAEDRAKIEQEIAQKISQGYSEEGRVVQELIDKLGELDAAYQKSADEAEGASNRRKFAMLSEMVFAAEDFSESHQQALEEVGIAWGVLTEEGVEDAREMRAEVNQVAESIMALTDKTVTLTLDIVGELPGMTSMAAQYAGQYINPEHRAAGGPVMAGSPYIVGEVGPELFVPGQSGQIVPSHAMGGSNTTVVINYQPTFSTASPQELEAFIPVVERSLRRIDGYR